MDLNKTYFGDCMEVVKNIPDDYVDLIVTSPPYADTLSYGNEVPIFHPDNYPRWFLTLAEEAARFLKPTGSFILNINDKIIGGKRSIYVYELLCLIEKETGLSLHDRYIWSQKSGIPTGGPRRLNDKIEYIFHFCRKKKKARGEGYTMKNEDFKSNIDEIREPYAEISKKRYKSQVYDNDTVATNGIVEELKGKMRDVNPKGKIPKTVFEFNNCGALRGKPQNKHPAPFHHDLPRYFIKWLTDKGDVVLDPFMGSGTTAAVCDNMERNWIGIELNDSYQPLIEESINLERNNNKP